MNRRYRILILSSLPLLRAGMAATLSAQADVEVVAACGDVTDALAHARELTPDVIVAHCRRGAIAELLRVFRAVNGRPMVILEWPDDAAAAAPGEHYGVSAVLGHDVEPEELVRAVYAADEREAADVAPPVTSDSGVASSSPTDRIASLSARELELFCLLAQGQTAKHIANELGLSAKTVANHYTRIKRKLGVSNASELTLMAIRARLLDPSQTRPG